MLYAQLPLAQTVRSYRFFVGTVTLLPTFLLEFVDLYIAIVELLSLFVSVIAVVPS